MDMVYKEMPLYRCHKEVRALKIKAIEPRGDGIYMVPEDTIFSPMLLDAKYVNKHDPQPGGYYVLYADGYVSYSPGKAFEEGYTLVSNG